MSSQNWLRLGKTHWQLLNIELHVMNRVHTQMTLWFNTFNYISYYIIWGAHWEICRPKCRKSAPSFFYMKPKGFPEAHHRRAVCKGLPKPCYWGDSIQAFTSQIIIHRELICCYYRDLIYCYYRDDIKICQIATCKHYNIIDAFEPLWTHAQPLFNPNLGKAIK